MSGGQDSTTCLFWAKREFKTISAITFDYGQRHQRELITARCIADMAGAEYIEVRVPGILKSRSPLTDLTADLETYQDYDSMDAIIGDRIEFTFVPMRNAFFLTLAANRAVAMDCFNLVTGVCEMDTANYPDCRESFILSQQQTISYALDRRFDIHTPLINLSKAQSIELAQTLPGCLEALAHSHTCYAGDFPPCNKCHACVLRAHGFAEAGILDPLLERAYEKSA